MGIWKKLKEILNFKVIDSKSKNRKHSVKSDEAIEGIYKFNDLLSDKEKIYIGQSEDIARRLNEHLSSEKLDELDIEEVEIKEVEGEKLMREIEEQKEIDKLGSVPTDNLSNKCNPISKERKKKLEKYFNDDDDEES